MTQIFRVEYLGAAKAGQGRPVSYAWGWVAGGWNLIFPESVLRSYFTVDDTFDGDFMKLLIKEDDLSRAYKRLAKVWHPDLNRAHDAADNFRKLKTAFDNLNDPLRRKRYEAGLKLAGTTKIDYQSFGYYRAPRLCGKVTVRTHSERYVGSSPFYGTHDQNHVWIDEIEEWSDIVDSEGRVMCSSWDAQARAPIITWEYMNEFYIDPELEVV